MTLELILTETRPVTENIRQLTFGAADGAPLPGYTAGAHVEFDLGDLGTRAYSLIDWQGDNAAPPGYTFAVQREADGQGGSQAMHALEVGARITATTPKNDFALVAGAPAVLLAGGIGITPLITMAASAQDVVLHYGARSRDVAGYVDDLSTALGDRVRVCYDDETPLDLAAICGAISPGTHLYICGPKGMIEAAKAAASAAGVPDDAVHFELFATPAPVAGDVAFEVEIEATGDVYTIPPGRTIIDVLEEAGVDVMYDCQRGDCGICQTDVIAGEPDHRDVVLSDDERASGKVMQICVSRAKSARLVLDI